MRSIEKHRPNDKPCRCAASGLIVVVPSRNLLVVENILLCGLRRLFGRSSYNCSPRSSCDLILVNQETMQPLPIDRFLPQIAQALRSSSNLILEAPPGTGKTTRVAPSLIDLDELPARVALIQPRRIAARAAASRIAYERGCSIGSLVGYQVRFDSQCGHNTRLISMTPGILLRRMQSDPLLEQFSAIVLDEFHERSQEMDLLLGLIRQIQVELRPELRIVVMSATLDDSQIVDYLGQPHVVRIDAISYPVDIRYQPFEAPQPRVSPTRRIIESVTSTAQKAFSEQSGDMLVFLPGVGEIMQVRSQLEGLSRNGDCEILTLFGDMSAEDQDRVLNPGSARRIILATNIAETSLTIDGVRIVVDSGWARVKRFDPTSGLDELRLEPISQASAKQRAGRAGRTQPGICYRMWDEITARSRTAQLEPEVLRADLSSAVLQLLSWGQKPEDFLWLSRPSDDSIAQARNVLHLLGACTQDQLSEMGRTILKFPVHPRLARLLIAAHRLEIPRAGAMAAALLSERDLFMKPQADRSSSRGSQPRTSHPRQWSCDITNKILVWSQFMRDNRADTELGTINFAAARNLTRTADQFSQIVTQELGQQEDEPLDTQLQQALLAAFPDRLARRRAATGPRGLMVGGRGVQLEPSSGVRAELFLCLDVDAGGAEASVRAASGIESDWLQSKLLREVDERFYNPTQQAVVTRRRQYWIDLMLSETPIATPLDDVTAATLSEEAARQFERLLPAKDKELHSLINRIRWLSAAMPEASMPTLEGKQLAESLQSWCVGKRSMDELRQLPWKSLVDSLLSNQQRRALDQQAPQSIRLPTGREVLLQYEAGKSPVLAARIQDFFGWQATPLLAGGRVPLTLHLLAPNQRCQQITDDLASFWKNTYPTVRKELRGRYPKHAWPENPLNPVE
jgi:ATP-dependent helicase HrpB